MNLQGSDFRDDFYLACFSRENLLGGFIGSKVCSWFVRLIVSPSVNWMSVWQRFLLA
jgi:hypothetical protein